MCSSKKISSLCVYVGCATVARDADCRKKIQEYIWPENSSYLKLFVYSCTGIYACMLQGGKHLFCVEGTFIKSGRWNPDPRN